MMRWMPVLTLAAMFLAGPGQGTACPQEPAENSPWQPVQLQTKASLRGLHVFSDKIVWASGSGGTLVHTRDGGTSWQEQVVADARELDFRDIQALSETTVVALTSGTPARIYRSTDAGASWQRVYENDDPAVFLDALCFWDEREGIVMGDPIDGKLWLLRTRDGGASWQRVETAPATLPGEAGFAASGTNTIVLGPQGLLVALGGALPETASETSRILRSADRGRTWQAVTVPLPRGPAAGIFSLAFSDPQHGVAVGGDYQKLEATAGNLLVTADGGRRWEAPRQAPPTGYRSGVSAARQADRWYWVAVGPGGTDVAGDSATDWQRVSDLGFHAVDFVPGTSVGWASGAEGRLARWTGGPPANAAKNSQQP